MRAEEATIILNSFAELSKQLGELSLKTIGLSEGQAVMKSQMATIQSTVTSNTILLRGDGIPGGTSLT